jgi:hypothetical protein
MKLWNKQGYTLVETLVTIVLGAFVITGIGVTLENGVFLTQDNRSYIYSANALREEMETLRNMNFDTMVALGSSSTFTNAQLAKLRDGVGTVRIASSFGSDIRKVTLNVAWTSRNGRSLSQSMTSYITRRGINGA